MKSSDEKYATQSSRTLLGCQGHRDWAGAPALVSLAVSIGLSGCMVGPNFQTPATSSETVWATPAEALSSPADPVAAGGIETFWTSFEDETLVQLLVQAGQGNLNLQSTAQQVEQARQQLRTTQGGTWPSVQISGNDTYSQPDVAATVAGTNSGANTYQMLGQLSWEIDFGGATAGAGK